MNQPTALTWGAQLAAGQLTLQGAHLPTPRLDASILLGHLLDVPRTVLLAHPERELAAEQVARYGALIARRAAGEPVAYLTGHRDFMGLDLLVDRRVLVPRPETELVVEAALAALTERLGPPPEDDALAPQLPVPDLLAADIGTGSGAIAIALASLEMRLGRIYAVDASADALEVARHNGDRLHVADRVSWLAGDLLMPVPVPVDVIVANLPYVIDAPGEVQPNVVQFEPHPALFGGDDDGLALIRRLISMVPAKLRPAGIVVLEHGYNQQRAIVALLAAALPGALITVGQDYAGVDRFVVARATP